MDRVSMKEHAKERIEGKIFMLFAIIIIVTAATSAVSMILGPVAPLMSLVIGGPVTFAMEYIYLNVTTKSRMPLIEDCIIGFKGENFTRTFVGYLRYFVFTLLWSLLFVVPGIIKSISYSQMFFLMIEDEDLDPADAQRQSMAMMDGHKGEYFMLWLSFIPWILLCIVTLGIAYIWVGPYMGTTFAEYHVRLMKKSDKKKIVAEAKKMAKESQEDYAEERAEFDAAVADVKKSVKKASKVVKKKASKAVADAADSVEKTAKEIKKEARKSAKKK